LDLTSWLGEMVRQVDSSLLDEWEVLSHPDLVQEALARGQRPSLETPASLTANERAFSVMVRNACFLRVQLAAKRDWSALGQLDDGAGGGGWGGDTDRVAWDAVRWEGAFAGYYAEHESIGTGPGARGPSLWQVERLGRRWRVRQVLDDPAQYHEWAIVFDVDLDTSDERGEPALAPVGVERLG
jgi:hypothetical protein